MIKFCDKKFMLAYLAYKRPRTEILSIVLQFHYVAKFPVEFAVMLLYLQGCEENRNTARVKLIESNNTA